MRNGARHVHTSVCATGFKNMNIMQTKLPSPQGLHDLHCKFTHSRHLSFKGCSKSIDFLSTIMHTSSPCKGNHSHYHRVPILICFEFPACEERRPSKTDAEHDMIWSRWAEVSKQNIWERERVTTTKKETGAKEHYIRLQRGLPCHMDVCNVLIYPLPPNLHPSVCQVILP